MKSNKFFFMPALLVAVIIGFGLAQVYPGVDKPSASLAHAGIDDDEHGHDDEDGHSDNEDHVDEPLEGVITLTAGQIKASGINIVAVGRGSGNEIRVAGRIESTMGARTEITTMVGGRIDSVLIAPGEKVHAGQPIAFVISGEAALMRANADAASAEADAARLEYQRDQNLVEQGVVARRELEASRARSLAADAAYRAARAQTKAIGSPDTEGRIAISSPIAGVVGAIEVMPGGFVASGASIADVSDPKKTEIVFTAPPALSAQIEPANSIEVSGPTGNFEAVAIGVAANFRQQGSATLIRARPVSGTLPPAGSPVSGIIVTNSSEAGLRVPADAVQTVDGRSVVFVAIDGGFKAIPVLAGRRTGGNIEILSGLSGSERIAGANAFLLKAELAKGEAEHSH
ncbi:efflux RND transporter periplasmic adaptor subunit [Halopseudomonas bauzanensis]|uniref:efflux RND transporter periplasmic adaptor subunit n=1 Tax=Halopseudomonas bauzanensis TaxID=653930 RepID=UPI003524A886